MKLLEVKLLTDNLSLAEKFYGKQLGFTRCHLSADELQIEMGSSVLIFRQTKEIKKPVYHFALNIPNNRLNEAIDWISAIASPLKLNSQGEIIADFRNWNAKSIYFIDPIGNIVEFIARFNLPNQSTEPFSVKSILTISEIGLVVNVVKNTVLEFADRFALDIFVPSTSTEQFAALGNDEGLFIVSEKNRHWYPTMINAQPFPLEIKFETDNNVVYNLSI
ncbi:glyoxalase [Solitalea longa]|uniref:Glyoxalase n=1 Tax=Solitalea longa TaxID=2079460 RepID=A0A2S5A9D8_9SPHI|nr:glyoxalase [Solitalea longa]POY39136.1 glyoxalase [Solitalea longa]